MIEKQVPDEVECLPDTFLFGQVKPTQTCAVCSPLWTLQAQHIDLVQVSRVLALCASQKDKLTTTGLRSPIPGVCIAPSLAAWQGTCAWLCGASLIPQAACCHLIPYLLIGLSVYLSGCGATAALRLKAGHWRSTART